MSIDGLFIACLSHELSQTIVGGRIDKVYMTDRLQAMISVRQPGTSHLLLASVHPQFARLSLTHQSYETPATPPVFCMVLRKHLLGGRIRGVTQPGLERLLTIQIECKDEYGRRSLKDLVVEIMGKYSNIVLLDSDSSIIIDCAKHVSSHVNRHRELLPGRRYILPPSQGKADLTHIEPLSIENVLSALCAGQSDRTAKNHLIDTFQGFGPLTATEVLHRAGIHSERSWSEVEDEGRKKVSEAIVDLMVSIRTGTVTPSAYRETEPLSSDTKAFSFTRLTHLLDKGYREQIFPMLADMLDFSFSAKEESTQVSELRSHLSSIISSNIQRLESKLAKQIKSLKTAENADELKLHADLLMAHSGTEDKGRKSVRVTNYFDPSLPLIEIEIDPSLDAVGNAKRYYKRYAKAKRSRDVLAAIVKSTTRELNYLNQVGSGVLCSSSLIELEEIRSELAEQGYIKMPRSKKKRVSTSVKSAPAEFVSSDGIQILVGRNNRQNDELTLRIASPDDIWFHVKDIPGSHVIIRRKGLKVIPDSTLTAAALLAAYYSKARDSSNVAVDYTLSKHVRKPQGAKPGMVIYDSQSTVYVTPSEEAIRRFLTNPQQLA